MLENFIAQYKDILYVLAEISASTLEFIGILIIIIGSVRALVHLLKSLLKREHFRIVASLGRALALALEFKMGAEIINTVIVRDLEELGILAIVVAIRALLAFLIHWEIKAENKKSKDEGSDK